MPRCEHPECTGNHHGYPNLCPRSKLNASHRKRSPEYREQDRVKHRERYEALDGVAYSHMLLRHRRDKAMTRMGRRSSE